VKWLAYHARGSWMLNVSEQVFQATTSSASSILWLQVFCIHMTKGWMHILMCFVLLCIFNCCSSTCVSCIRLIANFLTPIFKCCCNWKRCRSAMCYHVSLAPLVFTTLFTKAVNKTLVAIENEMILEIFNCQKLQRGEKKVKLTKFQYLVWSVYTNI
jgi:hypothetical protein